MKTNTSQINHGEAARKTALQLYAAIIEKQSSLSGLTDGVTGASIYLKLSQPDQALAKAILHAALRNRQQIDHILQSYLEKPLPKGARNLSFLLHISLAQLLYLRVATFATINIAVNLAKQDARMRRFDKLVNAVLRTALRDIIAHNIENKFFDTALENTPQWFSAALVADYGEAKAEAIMAASHNAVTIDLTVKNNPKLWAEKLQASQIWGNSIRLTSNCKTPIQHLEGYKDGQWWVQDCASTIPALLLDKPEFANIADLCAAPGGKTAQLINQGATVTAFDLNTNRCERLKQNMNRLEFAPQIINADFQTYQNHADFDAVLLDAPCSSTGTINKHSDILWTKNQQDIISLSQLQCQLLESAISYVKIGGTIIFSNCSLLQQEGEEVIERVLKENSQLRLNKIEPSEPIFLQHPALRDFITIDGFLRTTPDSFAQIFPNLSGAMDGFFIARLCRTA